MADPGTSLARGFAAGNALFEGRRRARQSAQDSASNRQIQMRRLGLSERAQDFTQQQAQRQQLKTAFDTTLKNRNELMEIATAAIQAGKDPVKVLGVTQRFHDQARQLGMQLGIELPEMDVGAALRQGTATPGDVRTQAAATQRQTQNIAAEAPVTEAQQLASSPQITRLQEARQEALDSGNTQAASEISAQINRLGTVVGRTAEDVTENARQKAVGRVLGKAEGQAEVSLAGRAIKNTLLRSLVTRARELGPGSVGLRAALGENVGGFAGQFSEGLGQFATRALTGGISQQELSDFRSDAKTIISQFLPDITGENAGRFTDTERDLAKDIVNATNVNSTVPQLIGAIGALTQLSLLTGERERFESKQPFRYNVSDDEGIMEAARDFNSRGLTVEQAVKLISNMQFLQQELGSVGR